MIRARIRGSSVSSLATANSLAASASLPAFSATPAPATTFGLASIGQRTIASYVAEFGERYPEGMSFHDNMETLAQELHSFFRQQLAGNDARGLGFQLVGYTADAHLPELYTVKPGQEEAQGGVIKNPPEGVTWEGVSVALERIHHGFDAAMLKAFLEQIQEGAETIKNSRLNAQDVQVFRDKLFPVLQGHNVRPNFSAMPIQQGVDYVRFLINVMIAWCRFMDGAPVCGPPVQVAVVTKRGYQELTDGTPRVRSL